MATSYTSLLGLALPVTGELSGTWGDTVNDYITQYLDAAVAGAQTISGSQTAVTLSKTTSAALTQAGSGATGSSQYQIINCTGNPGSLLTITVPAASKAYLVLNNTSTNQSVKVVGAGPTTGVTVAAARCALIAWNGSDFELVASTDVAALQGLGTGVATALGVNVGTAGAFVVNGGALGTPSSGTVTNLTGTASININGTVGATTPNTGAFTTLTTSSTVTLNGGTANGVAYLNGSKVLTTGSALTFDGTNLGLGTASPVSYANFSYLTVNGTNGAGISLRNTAGTTLSEIYENSNGLGIFSVSNFPIIFGVNNAEQMRLTSTGLGIGTSSPSSYNINGNAQLVAANTAGNGTISIVSSTTGLGYLGFADGTTGTEKYRGLLAYDHSTDSLSIRTAGSIVATLDASGNLGLGVTPSAWSGFPAIQVGQRGAFWSSTGSGSTFFSQNTYYNGGFKYIQNGVATNYEQNGAHYWYTAPSGTAGNAISFTQALTLDASGNLLLGGTTAGASSAASLAIFNGTAPTGSVTNGVILYAEDVSSSSELKVRDEAGNVTTLSPHNFSLIPEGPSEEMAWAYYSEKGGKRINVDMLKLARMVEKLTGEKLVYES